MKASLPTLAIGCGCILISICGTSMAQLGANQFSGTSVGVLSGSGTPLTLPFDFFDYADNGTSTINSYLLCDLSFRLYSPTPGYSSAWVSSLANSLTLDGLELVQFGSDPMTGNEFAIVENDGTLIIAFRGTSQNGSNAVYSYTDIFADLDGMPLSMAIGGHAVRVHRGFWETSNSGYADILKWARKAHQNGKRIWLTGHSLGGANATLVAARLLYDEKIPIQGLQTFGAPRVGDQAFKDLANTQGVGGKSLHWLTRRWAVQGDFATTLFSTYYVWGLRFNYWTFSFNWTIVDSITYHHIGSTNQIYGMPNNRFEIKYSEVEDRNMPNDGLLSLQLGHEHDWYDNALSFELTRVLTQRGQTQTLDILK